MPGSPASVEARCQPCARQRMEAVIWRSFGVLQQVDQTWGRFRNQLRGVFTRRNVMPRDSTHARLTPECRHSGRSVAVEGLR